MADANAEKAKTQKTNYWKGLKAEFRKIIWPEKDTVTKQTIVVLATSLALGVLISILDMIFKFGITLIIS